jgi:hypothetical protein
MENLIISIFGGILSYILLSNTHNEIIVNNINNNSVSNTVGISNNNKSSETDKLQYNQDSLQETVKLQLNTNI